MGAKTITSLEVRSAVRLFIPLLLILQLSLSGIAYFTHVSGVLSLESLCSEASSLQHFYVDDVEDKSLSLDREPLTFYDLISKRFIQVTIEAPLNFERSKTHSRSPPIS